MPTLLSKLDALLRPARRSAARALAQPITGDDPQRYLDPEALARLALTPMLVKCVVEGFINGLHKSPFHGFSVEFADHREYVPGDDLKFLDWPVFARTDHYYIRRYEQETNVRTQIILDCSASMGYGTGQITKWDYACFLCSCLGYLMLKQQDAAGLAMIGTSPGVLLPARSRNSHLQQMMAAMMRQTPEGGTDLATSLAAMARNLKRRSLVVIVSDLIDDPEEALRAIRLIGSRKHDVIVFHVIDEAEAAFNFDGPTLFRDMETGEEIEIDPAAAREDYLKQMADSQDFYRRGLAAMGIDYEPLTTNQGYDHALSNYLRKRTKVGG